MTTAKKSGSSDDKKTPGFEESLERLEKIVGQMESGELTLEQMIGHFEEGQSLIKVCSRKLNEVERKIEILVKKGDSVEAESFVDDDEAPGEGELF